MQSPLRQWRFAPNSCAGEVGTTRRRPSLPRPSPGGPTLSRHTTARRSTPWRVAIAMRRVYSGSRSWKAIPTMCSRVTRSRSPITRPARSRTPLIGTSASSPMHRGRSRPRGTSGSSGRRNVMPPLPPTLFSARTRSRRWILDRSCTPPTHSVRPPTCLRRSNSSTARLRSSPPMHRCGGAPVPI